MKIIKEAFAELEHVVWPTRRETKSYFKIVTIFILIFTLFLFVLGYVFGETIFGIKWLVDGTWGGTNVELSDSPINVDLSDVSLTDAEWNVLDIDDEQTWEINPEETGVDGADDITSSE